MWQSVYDVRAISLVSVLAATLLVSCRKPDQPTGDSSSNPAPTSSATKQAAQQTTPTFLREAAWAGNGTWLKIDTHIHTKFSDGAHTADQVAAKAVEFGCDAIAITDHADANLDAATPQYAEAIRAAREKFPSLVILAGLEWNLPPYGGREHVTLLVPQDDNEWEVLAEFKARFDHLVAKEPQTTSEMPTPSATDALTWLEAKYANSVVKPVLFLNHPSRKRADTRSVVDDMQELRRASPFFVGFSGAPGHQGFPEAKLGAYEETLQTINRWDPTVARVGGAWDQLLAAGQDCWAARAASDLHRAKPGQDYWPGEFSETWVYAPERSAAGVLQALEAGSFFAVHGHIAREVRMTLETRGLARMAMPGESVAIPVGTSVTVKLRFQVPERDWQGEPNRIDEVELIGIGSDDAQTLAKGPPNADGLALTLTFDVPAGGIVLRARGRRLIPDGPDLMFYTNPIRVVASKSEE